MCTSWVSLEEGVATGSSILAWRIPMERSLEGYSPSGCKESDSTEQLSPHSICLHGTQRQAPLRNEGVRRVLSWKARACAAFCVCLRE